MDILPRDGGGDRQPRPGQGQAPRGVRATPAVKRETARITKDWEYPLGKPKDEVVELAIRMYMATVQICKEKNFSGFSYKCVDGVDLEMGLTHAVPSSLVASAGYPYVDENKSR